MTDHAEADQTSDTEAGQNTTGTGTGVPYTGGITIDVQLPSGWCTVAPGDVVDCDTADLDALRDHPDFDTPPVDSDDPHGLADLTGPELDARIDELGLDVSKSLRVDERRKAIAEALTSQEG